MELYNDINNLNLVQRGVAYLGDDEIQHIGAALSTDVLFQWAKVADNFKSGGIINDAITHAWMAHPILALRLRLDDGVHHFKQDRAQRALDVVQPLVLDDPKYGEAWALMAMSYYEQDHKQAALMAAKKAIEVVPQHYNAMSLQGTVHLIMGEHEMAAQMLGECVTLDPWSFAANPLSAALDLLHNK
jgi:tetratricopeptide (TPR) repeat protein